MEQRYSILTLGTSDMARARKFYEGLLGWRPFMTEGMTAYDAGGFVFGLFGHKDLADDAEQDRKNVEYISANGHTKRTPNTEVSNTRLDLDPS